MEGTSARLAAGRIGRPHGLDGSFYVSRPRPRLLALGAFVAVAGRELEIVRRAGTDERPIVRLAGVEDRDSAQALRGLELTVAGASAPTLAEGEWWAHELEGCEVADGASRLGVVARLVELPSCEALEVAPDAGGAPLLVPMVKDAVLSVDMATRRIEVNLQFLGVEPPAREREGEEEGKGEGERESAGEAESHDARGSKGDGESHGERESEGA